MTHWNDNSLNKGVIGEITCGSPVGCRLQTTKARQPHSYRKHCRAAMQIRAFSFSDLCTCVSKHKMTSIVVV